MSKFGAGFIMPRKKRGNYKKKLSVPMAKAVGKLVDKKIHNNEEDKYLDLNQAIASFTSATNSTGSVVLLSGMAQGLTFATRVGEMINPRKLEFRLDCTSAQILGGSIGVMFSTNLRVIVFQDRQIRTSTLPTVADVLETVSYNSPLNHVGINSRRFHILYDHIFELDPNYIVTTATQSANTFTTQSSQRVTKKIKLSGKIAYTNASTGTERNNIYVLYLSDQSGNSPSLNMYSRLIFEDA